MSAGDKYEFIQQPGVRESATSDGGRTLEYDYLADLDTGLRAAAAAGYFEGMTRVIEGNVYDLAKISRVPHEEVYDRVTLSWQSTHGPSNMAPGQKKRKPGDEEWWLDVSTKSMSATEALAKGYIESLSDVHLINDDPDATTIYVPVPVLNQRQWIKGAKNDRTLPKTAEAALDRYLPIAATVGQPLLEGSKWYCTDLNTGADGALLMISRKYEWVPSNYPVLQTPTPGA